MTAVAAPPAFSQLNKQAWGSSGSNGHGSGNGTGNTNSVTSSPPDDLRLFPRKSLQRSNSSSSISSTSSTSSASSTTTVATNGSSPGTPASSTGEPVPLSVNTPNVFKKRPQQPKPAWLNGRNENPDLSVPNTFIGTNTKQTANRVPAQVNGTGNPQMAPSANGQAAQPNGRAAAGAGASQAANGDQSSGHVLLYLSSLNGTFEKKNITVPFHPEVLRIGRQTNQKTAPTTINGYFDSKVLSRQHAEIWTDRSNKIWIRDVKSSNGTFVNSVRLSAENRESEPHEVQTGDHLELGIDIIGEDGKTVIHHKVSAKVDYAGPANASGNLMDFGFNELDPSNGAMMSAAHGIQNRARNGSNPGMGLNGRMAAQNGMPGMQPGGMNYTRPFMLTPITTDNIIKKLQLEIRGARLQSHDIERSELFVNTLLTKDPLAPMESAPKAVTNGFPSFRADPKSRFSDPPAPPPQQPLPEKPTDVPSLKKSLSDRPKSHPASILPPREPSSQVLQLQAQLDNYKKDLQDKEDQLRVMTNTLDNERSARQAAEVLNQQLEEAISSQQANGLDREREEREAKELAKEMAKAEEAKLQAATSTLQARIEDMEQEMMDMRKQVELWKQRFEKADAERDIAQKSLAEMVMRIRSEFATRSPSNTQRHSRGSAHSSSSSSSGSSDSEADEAGGMPLSALRGGKNSSPAQAGDDNDDESSSDTDDDSDESGAAQAKTAQTGAAKRGDVCRPLPVVPVTGAPTTGASAGASTLANTNTSTGTGTGTGNQQQRSRGQVLAKGLPYMSVVGVVILGVGMMAFINGWQPQPRVEQ